jgi:hypothetical protein
VVTDLVRDPGSNPGPPTHRAPDHIWIGRFLAFKIVPSRCVTAGHGFVETSQPTHSGLFNERPAQVTFVASGTGLPLAAQSHR